VAVQVAPNLRDFDETIGRMRPGPFTQLGWAERQSEFVVEGLLVGRVGQGFERLDVLFRSRRTQ